MPAILRIAELCDEKIEGQQLEKSSSEPRWMAPTCGRSLNPPSIVTTKMKKKCDDKPTIDIHIQWEICENTVELDQYNVD